MAFDVKRRFDTLTKIKQGDTFNEEIIENEIKSVNSLFLRTGYMHSKWDYPNVIMDTANHTDSVVVSFNLGDRIKIGKIK
jgi:outer membrane protein assembly factor BamA